VAQELLSAPIICGGSAQPGGGGGGSQRSKISKPSKLPEMYENGNKTAGFQHLLTYKSAKILFFFLKELNKIYFPDVF
jgi:hypothetical protein